MGNKDAVAVLAVSPFDGDHSYLEEVFRHSRWVLNSCWTCAEASRFLKQRPVPVVMCEQQLPDGDWKDLLEQTLETPNPPSLIVTSRLADDHLWSEVLNLGGYDVLNRPFRESEVFRDVGLAFLHWKNRQPLGAGASG